MIGENIIYTGRLLSESHLGLIPVPSPHIHTPPSLSLFLSLSVFSENESKILESKTTEKKRTKNSKQNFKTIRNAIPSKLQTVRFSI